MPSIELTFTAIDSASHVKLDSIKVMNRTQGGDTVLYWPDTILVLDYTVGITEVSNEKTGLQIFQNYPNPVKDQTTITLYVPEKGKVVIMISDMLGRKLINTDRLLDRGYHSFRFTPGSGRIFFFTAFWQATTSSIKILNSGNGSGLTNLLEYTGSKVTEPQLKRIEATQNFSFSLGDTLLYIGYANGLQSGMLDAPEMSDTLTLQFATNIPCPGIPTVTYEGQVYNTIQIFSQCWLKENLNIGTMILGIYDMQDNGIIEKYCYDNDPANCDEYGGLYQWTEMMQYTTQQGTQGICPDGWHVPTDDEWKILEGVVDSLYGVGDPEWDQLGSRGFDAGLNLKSTNGWNINGNDLFGFSGLPGGYRYNWAGIFSFIGYEGYWWMAKKNYDPNITWFRYLRYNYLSVTRHYDLNWSCGFSVRCIRSPEPTTHFIELTFTAIDSAAYVQLDSLKVMNLTQGGDTTLFWPDTILVLTYEIVANPQKYSRLNRGIDFFPGDELLYIAYIDTLESGMLDAPETSDTLTLQFATNIPCPGTPTVTYEGQVYNTIQIFNQCWLKENLNVGVMIPGTQTMEDNGIIEKYCYDDNPYNCNTYGGLYQWNEMMQYTPTQGVQGICPPGWNIPTDEEWKVLEGAVDSQYGIGDPEWDGLTYRGYDAGKRLKSETGWYSGYNGTDVFGFTARPGGSRNYGGLFFDLEYYARFWPSSEYNDYFAWQRYLGYGLDEIIREWTYYESYGFSVRCLRDNFTP